MGFFTKKRRKKLKKSRGFIGKGIKTFAIGSRKKQKKRKNQRTMMLKQRNRELKLQRKRLELERKRLDALRRFREEQEKREYSRLM